MKLYVLVEIGYRYNDENYSPHDGDAGEFVKAYRVKENAENACRQLNAERVASNARDGGMLSEDGPITDFYRVAEIEVEDSEVCSYADAQAKLKQAQQEVMQAMQACFAEEAAKLFAKHPTLESFGWTQYTPYFNDGDECRFGVHTDEPDINGEDGGELDSGHRYGPSPDYKRLPDVEPSLGYVLQKPVQKFLEQFDAESMKATFGDHVKIVIRRDGTRKIEDHEHD